MLAGCALLLATYARSASQPPVAEALASYPLRQAALENAAEFVARHLDKVSVTADSHWQAQNAISETEYAAASGTINAASQLLEMLDQMGFKISLPQGAQAAATLATQRQALSAVSSGQTENVTLDAMFAAGGGAQTFKVGSHDYQVTVTPVSAHPNLNKIPAKALKRYLISLGLPDQTAETLTEALRHWRGDKDVLTAGQFESAYHIAASPYDHRGAPILDWSELTLLAGSSPDLVDFLRHHFSLTGNDARVLLSASSPQTIAALADLSLDDVTQAIAHLKGEHRDIALSDVIGASNAAKFEAAVVETPLADAPLTVDLRDHQQAVSLTYNIKAHTLDDAWFSP